MYGALLAVAFTAILFLISPEDCDRSRVLPVLVCFAFFSEAECGALLGFAGLVLALGWWGGRRCGFHLLDIRCGLQGAGRTASRSARLRAYFLFFAAIFVCACYVVRRFRVGGVEDNSIGSDRFSRSRWWLRLWGDAIRRIWR